jgi:predicted histidine transporter YuiF (NhaC family)
MKQNLAVVVGMSIAYLCSLLGLLLAYVSYRKKRKAEPKGGDKERP